jgi:hypothetical protein
MTQAQDISGIYGKTAEWKNRFATKGFMIALHVPSSLAKSKNRLTRALYRIGKTRVDVKKEWKFLNELKNTYVQEEQQNIANRTGPRNVGIDATNNDEQKEEEKCLEAKSSRSAIQSIYSR